MVLNGKKRLEETTNKIKHWNHEIRKREIRKKIFF